MSVPSVHARRISRLSTDHSSSSSLCRSRHASIIKRPVTIDDAYPAALRVAYLCHLLQPRIRRVQTVPPSPTVANRASAPIQELMKDFGLLNSKTTKLPSGFIAALEKRLKKILIGEEKREEYKDPLVKRTFALFLNALTEKSFEKQMEKNRRVEELVLIFFSKTTQELSIGKRPEDVSWKLTVDRHVALFVRLISLILKDNDWKKDRPELINRLAVLEKKLLYHDQDFSEVSQSNKTTVETIAPLSNDINAMPYVQIVGKIFNFTLEQLQRDINMNKDSWTAREAMRDLKKYQTNLSLGTKLTLCNDDFQTEEAFEAWRKAEVQKLSQMMLTLVQNNPELAQSSPDRRTDSVDISNLSLMEENVYTFIPADPRETYRYIITRAVTHDLEEQLKNFGALAESLPGKCISKQTAEFLSELCHHWRIPHSSRLVVFLEVFNEKYMEQAISLDTLDSVFSYMKDPPIDKAKRNGFISPVYFEREGWTVTDVLAMQKLLRTLHDSFLRELYEAFMHCYDKKPQPLGTVIGPLKEHIEQDPMFFVNPEEINTFRMQTEQGLIAKAKETYQQFLDTSISPEQDQWSFYDVIELSKKVLEMSQRIQKRYRKSPEIEGVNPLSILVNTLFPMLADDIYAIITGVLEHAKEKGEEVPVEDGFVLYKELSEIRDIYVEVVQGKPFPFNVEPLLEQFVQRWILLSGEKITDWVERAIEHDNFQLPDTGDDPLPDNKRYTSSVVDIFRSLAEIVSQVADLHWSDEVAHARFMTEISRSIGIGLIRYCEVLEKAFAKEMDRLSPEQEASLTQSTQEKWMSMARDAWNNKEKVEPFQFLPQSFVKLNNIVYSLQHLDWIEKEVNADACADVLTRIIPMQKKRKATSYVFTVKTVEAEDLKACDVNGLSDPYVVLADECQRRISKTRVVYNNLNPRWDDSVDILTKGPLNLIATIWDWDAVGDHDYVGRTALKLDPSHFQDFGPRDLWLDLDTQGRLLLRVSMEGERDDIQFYFAKTFRMMKRTERDMTRKITDKLSDYIIYCLSRRTLKSLQTTKITMATVSSYFNRNKKPATSTAPTVLDIERALEPLFTYFNDNFFMMRKTLTEEAMRTVMTRVWKEVLATIESLMVPPLSDKPSAQRPLSSQDLDIVSVWLEKLFGFFNAVDDETGEENGVPQNLLKSPKYYEIQSLFFFYTESTDDLIRTSERIAAAALQRQQQSKTKLTAASSTLSPGPSGASSLLAPLSPLGRRGKSIMLSRNLGTMRKAKEDKWREAQAEQNDDMILRILRMRPEAGPYLRERGRQKERMATVAAANRIVQLSLSGGGGGRMGSTLR